MKLKRKSRWVLSGMALALAAGASADGGQFSLSMRPTNIFLSPDEVQKILDSEPPRAINDPAWKDADLVSIRYIDIGGACAEPYSKPNPLAKLLPKKKGPKLPAACNTGTGVVRGKDLLDLAHPAEEAVFEQVLKARGETGDLKALYQQYLKQLTDQAMGLLILNRILDHKVATLELPAEATDDRVGYVMRAILVQNAVNRGKVRTRIVDGKKVADEAMDYRSHQELYGWLQETVGTHAVRFNMDWTYADGGLGFDLDQLRDETYKTGIQWPSVSLTFMQLPATYQEFRSQLKDKLDPTALTLARTAAWRFQVQSDDPLLSWQSLFAVTTTELDHMYDALKESTFKAQDQDASLSELDASGPKAAAFLDRYKALLAQREADLLGQITSGKTDQKIPDMRRTVPREVYNQAVTEFGADIIHGDLKVSILPRKLSIKGLDPLPAASDQSEDAQITRMVLNPMSTALSLFPKLDLVGADGTLKLVLLEDMTPGAVSYVDPKDERAQALLRQKIMAKKQGEAFRSSVLKLLVDNRVDFQVSTCNEPAWPCASTDPRQLVDAILPVKEYAGHPEYADRVFEISSDVFSRVFEIPNK